jgi:hypothetical protein
MAPADFEPSESPSAAGLRASHQFKALVDLVDDKFDEKPALLNELQRFQLWASSLGLYHGGHSSLDYRFRDSPLVFRYTYKLLCDLEGGLLRCLFCLGPSCCNFVC